MVIDKLLFDYRLDIERFGHGAEVLLEKSTSKTKAQIAKAILETRLDERKRMSYHIDLTNKELSKGNIIDMEQWYKDDIVEPHTRRIAELTKELEES